MFKFLRNLFCVKETPVSDYEKELRSKYKDKWIRVSGSNDSALEAVVNAAWNSDEPVVAQWDNKNGLQKGK